jgi:hypothetical protein
MTALGMEALSHLGTFNHSANCFSGAHLKERSPWSSPLLEPIDSASQSQYPSILTREEQM